MTGHQDSTTAVIAPCFIGVETQQSVKREE